MRESGEDVIGLKYGKVGVFFFIIVFVLKYLSFLIVIVLFGNYWVLVCKLIYF